MAILVLMPLVLYLLLWIYPDVLGIIKQRFELQIPAF